MYLARTHRLFQSLNEPSSVPWTPYEAIISDSVCICCTLKVCDQAPYLQNKTQELAQKLPSSENTRK